MTACMTYHGIPCHDLGIRVFPLKEKKGGS